MKSLQWYSGRKKLEIRKKEIVKILKEPKKEKKKTQIQCHEIEPNQSKIILRLAMNL
jgi:hypothetical protein